MAKKKTKLTARKEGKSQAVPGSKSKSSNLSKEAAEKFTERLAAWGQEHGRKNLPWQTKNPYQVWISEIMLQQTQVETVKSYFERFLLRFPDLAALARADEEAVLAAWAGLGYYRRAKFLRAAAQQAMGRWGALPTTAKELATLPGIGRSTAAAIASICHQEPVAIMDGNVQRVLARFCGITDPINVSAEQKRLWGIAELLVPKKNPGAHTQNMMDLGALICVPRAPKCDTCPQKEHCVARRKGLQNVIPKKEKKAKARRVEMEQWRVAHDDRRVMLMKNESESGVWQSLWVFPAFTVEDIARSKSEIKDLGELSHAFSHYDLKARVWSCSMDAEELDEIADRMGATPLSWTEAKATGIPTPVRKVIELIEQGKTIEKTPTKKRSKK